MGRLFFSITRTLFVIANLIILALACFLSYMSLSALDPDFGMDTLNDSHPKMVHNYISIICLGVGIIVALLSIIGLYGAIKRSIPALNLYSGVIIFIVFILLILVILSYTMKPPEKPYRDIDKNIVNSTIAGYSFTDSTGIDTIMIDYIQEHFKCCGFNSPNDWLDYSIHKIPKSCCSSHATSTLPTFHYCLESEYKDGCWKAIASNYREVVAYLKTCLSTTIVFCIFGIIEAMLMVRFMKRSAEVV